MVSVNTCDTYIMEERHKIWLRELSKSFILKSLFNKKQPNLLEWNVQKQVNFILFSYHWEMLWLSPQNISKYFFTNIVFKYKVLTN